jgi:hypothetical protein
LVEGVGNEMPWRVAGDSVEGRRVEGVFVMAFLQLVKVVVAWIQLTLYSNH